MDARILTNWTPSTFNEETIEREFTELLPRLGITTTPHYFSVRSPAYQCGFLDYDVSMSWHRDGADMLQIVWSNIMPTMLRDSSGQEMQPAPSSVVLFDNTTMEHRGPQGINKTTDRWFLRCYLPKTPEHLKLLTSDTTTNEKGTN